MCEAADASELFDAVFTGDNLISKPGSTPSCSSRSSRAGPGA
jgi:hypothetical protein